VDNRSVAKGIGQRLREERVARGVELAEVTEHTKIRAQYLRALEEERWDALPGAAYARGFLRTYAEFLGLDADALVGEYRLREAAEGEPEPPPVRQIGVAGRSPGPVPQRATRLPFGGARLGRWALAGAAAAAALALILVLGLSGGSENGDEKTGDRTTPARGGQRANGDSENGEGRAPVAPPSRVALRLTATGTVWVCVVDQDGEPVVEGVTVPAGEELGPFRGREFEVGLGNGQVEIEANDEPVPIPAAANPLGYRITGSGARELDAGERPTCS
jgi:cytoskeleton protein RodZ